MNTLHLFPFLFIFVIPYLRYFLFFVCFNFEVLKSNPRMKEFHGYRALNYKSDNRVRMFSNRKEEKRRETKLMRDLKNSPVLLVYILCNVKGGRVAGVHIVYQIKIIGKEYISTLKNFL